MLLTPILQPKEFDGELYVEFEYASKHLAKFMAEVERLQAELDKTYNQLKKTEKDSQEKISELESELEVKDNLLKIKNGLLGNNNDDLPDDPMEVAQMLINSTYEYELSTLEKTLYKCGDIRTTERYSINDLEQIAEHLLVYCKHHREDDK